LILLFKSWLPLPGDLSGKLPNYTDKTAKAKSAKAVIETFALFALNDNEEILPVIFGRSQRGFVRCG
jgi:hypothetical protein